MFGRGKPRTAQSKFSTRSVFIAPPKPEPMPIYEDEYVDEEEAPVIIKPPSKKGRLPGVKLLRKLARERRAEIDAQKEIGFANLTLDD